MLNWAARYYPILRSLRPEFSEGDSLLEIGSGPVGIGKFHPAPFVGCDINFPWPPKAPMKPVVASATNLPFSDQSFDAVVASDVLEHVPPDNRMIVIREALRVARKIAIFGFPSGSQAFEFDVKLAKVYDQSGKDKPEWLEEHMRYQPFPTKQLFDEIQSEWLVSSFENENAVFHNWVMRQEMHRPGLYGFRVLLALVPRLMERLLRYADREPFYRQIVVVKRLHMRSMLGSHPLRVQSAGSDGEVRHESVR
jgi:hypothetical protein